MNVGELEKIRDELTKESWKYLRAGELQKYFDQINITLDKDSLLTLLLMLVKKDVFPWLNFISDKLTEIASSDDRFVELISKISDKVQHDLAQGPYVKALIAMGENDSALGIAVAQKMIGKGDVSVNYASFPLGGAGRKIEDTVYKLVEELFQSEDPARKFCALRTIRVMFEGKKIPDKAFNFLTNVTKETEDVNVIGESLQAFLDFYDTNPTLCREQIMNLAKQHSNLRFLIADRLWIRPLSNQQDNIDFLKICAEDKNNNVRERVSYALTRVVDSFPEEIMEIIGKWIEGERYFYDQLKYLLEELGKKNFNRAMKVVENWIEIKPDIFYLYIPKIVNDLLPNKEEAMLIPYITRWFESDEKHIKVGIDTLHEVLSGLYTEKNESEFASKSLQLLSQLATEKGFDAESIIKGENNKILQCAKILNALKYYDRNLDYDIIQNNLKEFPSIEQLFDRKWLSQKKQENNRTHPTLRVLARELPKREEIEKATAEIGKTKEGTQKAWFLTDFMFLERLDANIQKLINNGLNSSRIKRDLMNEEQVAATLSEIEFAAPFVGNFNVEMYPKVNGKELDISIKIDGQTVFVEVISPDMFKPLELLTGPMMGVPNRIKSKIFDEFKKQLVVLSSINQPVIVAIDIGRSEVDYEFVQDYLFGTLKMTWVLDKKTHETVDFYNKRDTDSMHDRNPNMDIISAVICFKTRLHSDLKYRTEGKIIENPYARTPLTPSIINKIEETLFV